MFYHKLQDKQITHITIHTLKPDSYGNPYTWVEFHFGYNYSQVSHMQWGGEQIGRQIIENVLRKIGLMLPEDRFLRQPLERMNASLSHQVHEIRAGRNYWEKQTQYVPALDVEFAHGSLTPAEMPL